MRGLLRKSIGERNVLRLGLLRKRVRVNTKRFFRRNSGRPGAGHNLPVQVFSRSDAHVFFGYYDLSPFGAEENLLLAMVAPLVDSTPMPGQQAKLGYFDLEEDHSEFREFGSTETWCWQQGCRLQWYPAGGKLSVLYNTLIDRQYGCVVQDAGSGKILRTFRRPIYAVSGGGDSGLSVDFARLQRLRPGYGYNSFPDKSRDQGIPSDDGIWRIDLTSGEEKLLFSLREIADLQPDDHTGSAQHYFNHLLFNPDGSRFMFFHLCRSPNGSRKARLLTSSIAGDNIQLLNRSGHVSHYCWRDNDHLLCYSTVAGHGQGYYLYNVISGETQIIGDKLLVEDGHPTYFAKGHYLVTDTYPDDYGDQSLLLYNSLEHRLLSLSKEYSPVQFYGELRCDLHPRVSASGKRVCIDCVVRGRRGMKVFNISKLIR